MSGKTLKVHLKNSHYGLKKAPRQRYRLLVGTLQDVGFEQCLVDSCVLRLRADSEVVAMPVVHVDNEAGGSDVTVDILNDTFTTMLQK